MINYNHHFMTDGHTIAVPQTTTIATALLKPKDNSTSQVLAMRMDLEDDENFITYMTLNRATSLHAQLTHILQLTGDYREHISPERLCPSKN